MEKISKLDGGVVQARCPACAEAGQDRKGEHLRILADGRFGCCVHPQDGNHRKRIFALAGCKPHFPSSSGTFAVRANALSMATEARSVKLALTAATVGTQGTGNSKSDNCAPRNSDPKIDFLGTRGTPCSNPNVYSGDILHTCKDIESGVPSVPIPCDESTLHLPFLTAGGDVSIPFESPERYHWWRGGQSVEQTRAEVLTRMAAETASQNG